MKKEILKTLSALLAVSLTATIFASCGRSSKEPEDSLIPTETYLAATVAPVEEDALDALVQDVLGEQEWDGDYSKLTEAQRQKIELRLKEKGYSARVTDKGVTYFDYVPTADADEIAEVVQDVLGDKEWDGKYNSLSAEEKQAVRKALNDRGYDVDLGKKNFEFKNEIIRREETTKAVYNQLPNRENIAAAVADVLGNSGYSKWDGDLLSLTEKQRSDILQKLNDYGFDLGINSKGELYIIHSPENTVTFDTAYTGAMIGGTTQAATTVATTAPEGTTENLTGTTAAKETPAPAALSTQLSGFGGTAGDGFYAVAADRDGGYIAVARFQSNDGDFAGTDAKWRQMRSALVKYDKNGNYRWKLTLGGTSLNAENGVSIEGVAVLADGGYIAVGYTDAGSLGVKKAKVVEEEPVDAILWKVSADGQQEWIKLISGSRADEFLSVAAAPDGGFVVGGFTYSDDGDFPGSIAESKRAILMKFNASGEIQWMQGFNSGTYAAQFKAVAVTPQGYIYAACNASSIGTRDAHLQLDMAKMAGYGHSDAIIMKFTPEGKIIAWKAIAGSGADVINCIALAEGGGIVIGGTSARNERDDSVFAGTFCQGKGDAFVIRLDASLKVEWVKMFGGIDQDTVTGIAPVKGGYVITGHSSSDNCDFKFLSGQKQDGFLIMLSENGTGVEKYALSGSNTDQCEGVAACANGKKIAVVGFTISATNHFSAISPTPQGMPVCFIEWFDIK